MPATPDYKAQRSILDTSRLMQEACEESGLNDYGNTGFVKGLEKLLECTARDTNFHAEGLDEFRKQVIRQLVNRLRFQNDLKNHPEIVDEDVSDPIIILGMARSGTTKTQRMMATDPSLLKTYMWQLMNPAPFPNEVPGKPGPRIDAVYGFDNLAEDRSDIQASHHFAVDNVDEDWQLFDFTMNDWYSICRNPSQSFTDWVMTRKEPSDLDNYRYVQSLFQYLQWQQGGKQQRRWLSKNCGYITHLEELMTIFPNASLMHIHRHPVDFMSSWTTMMFNVWSLRVTDLDPKFVGKHLFDCAKAWLDAYMVDRDRLNLDAAIYDVQYDQIRSDPMPVMREIYSRAGHPLTAEAERNMQQWEKENEQHKYGKQEYSLETFGLSKKILEDGFSDYIQRFIKQ